jgi:hypothetical protein
LERSTLQYEAAGPAGTRFHKDSPNGGIVTLQTQFKSPLHQTVVTAKTDFWNDSCSIGELTYAIEHGAVGATSNPTIVEQVLRLERDLWDDRIHQLISENPDWTEEDVMWKIFGERIPDFRRAYEPDGLTPAQFDTYGTTVRTLRGFIASYHELIRVIREDYMLPNPDVK